ncbi:type VII secretion protein EccB [Yinghuangia soli]|uniref:Type VII secretion protein EccB n=1 Tax=Yinghuangia soli TaxID=2908204 RepID=A0AA41QB37_9ACTN|nr:type VII secretion protein EccB [Yinghuangia soli]MCF2533664.1 type VII secretion protein EccB [Yinghuangia soli]
MASRREQLEAYTFARRRLVAGFLQPEPAGGNEEKAPRAFRAILPGIVVGALILTGFGVYGLIKPGVPPGWKNKGSLIVGRDSASRYVYIDNQLHPVLNIASGRLLLEPTKFKVNLVPEKVLNSVRHGAPLGIPNAPDRLPGPKEVTRPKSWTVCERPVVKGNAVDLAAPPERSVFIGSDDRAGGLMPADALFVQLHAPSTQDGSKSVQPLYLVEGGRKYRVGVSPPAEPNKPVAKSPNEELVRAALGLAALKPQPVSQKWLDTLEPGADLTFPELPGYGTKVAYDIPEELRNVGMVLRTEGTNQYYVVGKERVLPVTRLVAELLVAHPDVAKAYPKGRTPGILPVAVSRLGANIQMGGLYAAEKGWPETLPQVVNRVDAEAGAGRTTLCNTYTSGPDGGAGLPVQTARNDLPEELVTGMGGVWVKPGTGALIREFIGTSDDKSGTLFLVTDAGLRYQIPNEPEKEGGPLPQGSEDSIAKIKLGYKGIAPSPVPRAWAELMPLGVPLSHLSAAKPQTS